MLRALSYCRPPGLQEGQTSPMAAPPHPGVRGPAVPERYFGKLLWALHSPATGVPEHVPVSARTEFLPDQRTKWSHSSDGGEGGAVVMVGKDVRENTHDETITPHPPGRTGQAQSHQTEVVGLYGPRNPPAPHCGHCPMAPLSVLAHTWPLTLLGSLGRSPAGAHGSSVNANARGKQPARGHGDSLPSAGFPHRPCLSL